MSTDIKIDKLIDKTIRDKKQQLNILDSKIESAKALLEPLKKEVGELTTQKVELRATLKKKEDELLARVEDIKKDAQMALEANLKAKDETSNLNFEIRRSIEANKVTMTRLLAREDAVSMKERTLTEKLNNIKEAFDVLKGLIA